VFDRPIEGHAFAVQLKKLYRGISALEGRILKEDADENGHDDGRIVVSGRGNEVTDEDAEVQKWNKLIADHKQCVMFVFHLRITDWFWF
jgi:protein SMG6